MRGPETAGWKGALEGRAGQLEALVAHLKEDARVELELEEGVEAAGREGLDSAAWPVSFMENPPAPAANGNS